MAYSGLGSGTQADPYQITTVAQFYEMGVSEYTGKYFQLMNDLNFSSKSTFAIEQYAILLGGGFSITNIPCAGNGFYLFNGCSIRNIRLLFTDAVYSTSFSSVIANYGSTLSNISLSNIYVYNDILVQSGKNFYFADSFTFDNTCSINNIVFDGNFASLLPKISCVVSDIKLLNSFRGLAPLVRELNPTGVLEFFQIIKPITITNVASTMVCGVIYTGATIRYGFIKAPIIDSGSATFAALTSSSVSGSGTLNISNIYFAGNITSTSSDWVNAMLPNVITGTISISKLFFVGNMVTPNISNRNKILGGNPGALQITSSFYNKTVLTGIPPVDATGQTGLTSSECIVQANYPGWDFSSIWEMGIEYPILKNTPEYNLFSNLKYNCFINTPSRISSSQFNVGLIKSSNDIFGLDVIDSSQNIIANVEGGDSLTPTLIAIVDATYTLKAYGYNGSTKVYLVRVPYFHYYENNAVLETNVVADKYQILNDGTNKGIYIHGSVIHNGYVYGVSRNMTDKVANGCIIKAPVSNVNNYTIQPIIVRSGEFTGDMDSLVLVGDFLYTICNSGQTTDGYLIKYNTLTDDYQVYKISTANIGSPSCTDGVYLYFLNNIWIVKVALSIFNSVEKYNLTQWPLTGAMWYTPVLHYTQGILPHTMTVDDTYLYVGFGYGQFTTAFEVQKIQKSDMTLIGYAQVPKMTDDMTQTETHLFLGVELYQPTNATSFGYGWGTCAIRKSDMRVTKIPKLHKSDSASTISYASLLFGNYIIDCKTSKYLYALDISDVDNWDITENIGKRTLKAYKMLKPDGVTSFPFPTNELMLDESGTFVGFIWSNISDLASFNLTGLNYFAPPTVTTDDSAIIDSDSVSLSGTISNNGGKTVTACGVIVGQVADLSDGISFPLTPISNEFIQNVNNIGNGTYYWRAYATNAEGIGYGEIKSFVITPAYTDPGSPSVLDNTNTVNVELSWSAPSDLGGANLVGFKIERKPVGGEWSIIVPNTDTSSTTYLDTVSPGNYVYRISTITEFSTSLPSVEYNVTATIGGVASAYKIYLGSTEIALR